MVSAHRTGRELVLIEDPKSRPVTFSKRKSGLFKKASELSFLCGARVAAVVFSATSKPSAVGAPSVEHVISNFAPLPSDDDREREREVMEATARRAKETGACVAEEKTRMGAVGEKVLRAAATSGARFWWQADAQALGEEELREFTTKLRQLGGQRVAPR